MPKEQPYEKLIKFLGFFGKNSPLTLLVHLGLMFLIVSLIIIYFFWGYLPSTTDHGETKTVPDLTGLTVDEAAVVLEELDLRYEVYDDSSASNFTLEYPPYAILDQNPTKNEKVKDNRKIYLTVNPPEPPIVTLPDIIDASLKASSIMLENNGLLIGEIEYKDDVAANAVLGIKYKGRELDREQIRQGFSLKKGSSLDLVLGNGKGQQRVELPNLVGLPFERVEQLLKALGLEVGQQEIVQSDSVRSGLVVRQSPDAVEARKVRYGSKVDLWIASE